MGGRLYICTNIGQIAMFLIEKNGRSVEIQNDFHLPIFEAI